MFVLRTRFANALPNRSTMTSEKDIELSQHARLKIEAIARHGVIVDLETIAQTIRSPDRIEVSSSGRSIAQQGLTLGLVLRVVYYEYPDRVVVITLYPGKRSRYEQS